MKVYHGKSVFGGIAIGKTAVYKKSEQQVKRVKTEDSDGEWARYQAAREASIEQLGSCMIRHAEKSERRMQLFSRFIR